MENLSTTAAVIIFTLISSEFIYSYFTKNKTYDSKDSITNVVIGLTGGVLMKTIWNLVMLGGFALIYTWTPLRLEESSWWYWPLGLILSDFSYYWYHRFGHEVRLFWGTHSVHHSSEDYNLSTSVRLSWLESSWRWLFWAPLPLLGFDPIHAGICYLIVRYYQVWLHTRSISSVPYFEKIFTVPSHHRVHHGTNPQYIDKNYGGCLIIWDKIFGTFEPEEEAVVYGVLKPIETYNPFKINFDEYIGLAKDVYREPSWKNKHLYLFKKPGWSSDGKSVSEAELFQQKISMGYGQKSEI